MEHYPQQPSPQSSLLFAYQSAKSLLYNIPDRPGVIFRPIYEENASRPGEPPFNVTEEVLPNILSVIRARNVDTRLSFRPYWNSQLRYNPAEVFGAAIQSVDLHDAPLPKTVLPPEDDVRSFIQTVEREPTKTAVDRQLDIALDIADADLLGAVNVCWIATRFMARGADQRAYPGIAMSADILRGWNDQLAQFELSHTAKNDGPGDNYYFWTHVFGAMAFSERSVQARLGQTAFSRGTEIMKFVRKYIAREQPNITAHQPASNIGRQVGLVLARATVQTPGLGEKLSPMA